MVDETQADAVPQDVVEDVVGPLTTGEGKPDTQAVDAPSESAQKPAPPSAPPAAPPSQTSGMRPPPPKFTASTSQRQSSHRDIKSALAVAASAAAASVAPAQRERAILQAATQMLAHELERESAQPSAPPASAPSSGAPASYPQPDWAGVPTGVPYTLEVLKGGSVLEKRDVADKDHYTFGRSPAADFTLEHPSASRLHAVLQYQAGTNKAFMYDCNSTHGTFLNKQRLKPNVHAPIRVGDTLKFGQSSRLYVFGGPEELLPEEGLTRRQKQQLALLEGVQRQKAKDSEASKAQMELVLSRGATWGMAEDAVDEDGEGLVRMDWREFSDKHGLSEKMEKSAEKIRKKEWKMSNLRTECERIRAKEKQEGGLTPGQASTLIRNEQAIDALAEEVEEMEEALNEAVADSLNEKRKVAGPKKSKRKRTASDEEDEAYAEGSDSEDDFYDRTQQQQRRAAAKKGKATATAAAAEVESVESLHGKRAVYLEERKRIESEITAEEQRLQQGERAGGTGQQGERAGGKGEEDSLDAFMSGVNNQMEQGKVLVLKKELAEVERQLQRAERLLKIADPGGWYQPNDKDLATAKAAASQRLKKQQAQQERAAALEAKRRAEKAAQQQPFVPEVEEEEDNSTASRPGQQPTGAAPSGSSRMEDQGVQQPLPTQQGAPSGGGEDDGQGAQAAAARSAAAEPAGRGAGSEEQQQQPSTSQAGTGGGAGRSGAVKGAPLPPRQQHRKPVAATAVTERAQPIAAAIAAAATRASSSLALLASARQRPAAEGDNGGEPVEQAAEQEASGWVPPEGQTGDGRTSLNDRYGY